MKCQFIKSEFVHRSGQAYWYCSRKGCTNRCVSDDGKCMAVCTHPTWKIPLGDIVATAIKVFTLGTVKPTPNCRCKDRQKKLNEKGVIPLPGFLVKEPG